MKKASECRTFVVAGHPGSGKTSLCDLLLFKAKAVDRLGSVDQKNSVSDFSPEEQEKHSSIYSSVLNCVWKDTMLFMLDTPGYGEFVGECISAMRAADAALVVLDGVEGPQVGTARAWRIARQRGIPRFGLVNRLERERADFAATLEKMRANHGKNVVLPVTWPVGCEGNFSRVINVLTESDVPTDIAAEVAECRELWMDAIAETDEELMTRYLEGQPLTSEEIKKGMKAAVLDCKVIPVFAGSSIKDIGITELMDAMVELFPSALERKPLAIADGSGLPVREDGPGLGLVFKNINDPFIGQLTFVRVLSGSFKSESEVLNLTRESKERLGQFLLMNGKMQTPVSEAGAGYIVALAKLKDVHINDTLSTAPGKMLAPIDFPKPTMSYAVTAAKSGEDEKVTAALQKIAGCDATVRLFRDPETHELLLTGMGDQHLAIVAKRLRDVYKVEAVLSTPKIPYRETITANGEGSYRHKKQSGGSGQFAEVHLRICPNQAGHEFVNEVVGGSIPRNFIPAVEKGVADAMSRGPLVGCPVERVKVAVFDGKYHPVDSNEMAFKIAGRMAFREAMSKAKPVLLEPIMNVHIHIPGSFTGDITGDLNHRRGRILGMDADEGMDVVNAEVPLVEMHKYTTELRSMTQGRGSFEMDFARYEQVPANVAAEIIAKHQHEKEEDKD
jgi:elongation factor G